MEKSAKSLLFTGLAILFWGTSATAFKIALQYITPFNLLFTSSFFSTIIIFIIILSQKKWFLLRSSFKTPFLKMTVILGLLNPFGYYIILFQAYDLLPGQIAMSLNYAWPIALTILSVPLLKQPLGLKQFIAIFISFFGVVIISGKGEFLKFDNINMWGVTLALFSTVIWAVFWLLNVKDKHDPVIRLFYGFFFGTVFSIIFSLFHGDLKLPSFEALGPVLYISCFEMGITFVVWLLALKNASNTAKIGNLIFITPFLSLVFLRFILGEELYISTFSGLLLVIIGILIQRMASVKRP